MLHTLNSVLRLIFGKSRSFAYFNYIQQDLNREIDLLYVVARKSNKIYLSVPFFQSLACFCQLKVSKFQNESMKSWFLSKYERKIVKICAL